MKRSSAAVLLAGALAACQSSQGAAPAAPPSTQPAPPLEEPWSSAPFVPTPPTLPGALSRCATSNLAPPTLRRLTVSELEQTIRDVFPGISGEWSGVALGPDPRSALGFSNDASSLLVSEQIEQELLLTAKQVATLLATPPHLAELLPCSSTTADSACAAELVERVGPSLYRRPLEDQERAELLGYHAAVAARSSFGVAVKWTLVSMLQSPAFLYRSELGDASGELSQYEIASALAFSYGGSTPSSELLQRAARAELTTPDARAAVAEELLHTPRGETVLMRFFREWLGYERVLGLAKAQALDFATKVAPLLTEETRRFISSIVLERDGSVAELLTSPQTFMNQDLAAFYGYGAAGADFMPVERPAGRGIGLLAQASVLAGRSHFDITSPVLRGLLVDANLLCQQPGQRPPVVPTLPADDATAPRTTRERFESLHSQPACAACHRTFEPFGYGLEQFDATGRYRPKEANVPLDTHASVTLDDQTTLAFDGLDDLEHQLASLPEVTNCVSGLLASYFFAGAGGQTCLAETARSHLASSQIGLRTYWLSLARSPSLSHRAPAATLQ